ncbi:hypothetical protein Bb109J_c1949 [Bdellovibrio bacteriovorus]|uniref:hypothetical protein n=1 Tax=Bdellovibrio bacteriovorus TaxID=959 RepID=UPI00045C0E20|nr:hypothetical protein [Bdellovibrio bacteriovorus]AHZ84639.1 hypothetical protein EP01_06770 [Bdellovibrio bacteriovorus]BEV68529.1 hypothetical protein Bb109J_c1949 [Bdellovibrio bacteriovorus]
MKFVDIPIRVNDIVVDAGWWNIIRTAGMVLSNLVSGAIGAGAIQRTTFSFVNNQATPAPIVGLVFDSAKYSSSIVEMEIHRKSSGSEVRERTELVGVFAAGAWALSQGISNANSGITFTVEPGGQVNYQSTNQLGVVEVQQMTFRTTTMGAEGG